jgi:uncharacterized protein (DUF302 family)
MINYGFKKELDIPFEDAIELVTKSLAEEGFGILTTIDVKEKFREKLGIEFSKYVILGACNPAYAHRAILTETDIGLMLPCNVIIYEKDDKTVISAIKPTAAMQMIHNKNLQEIAVKVETKLKKIIESVAEIVSKGSIK